MTKYFGKILLLISTNCWGNCEKNRRGDFLLHPAEEAQRCFTLLSFYLSHHSYGICSKLTNVLCS